MDFEILIDDAFVGVSNDASLAPINNKTVTTIVNDFEDGAWRYKKFQSFIWDNVAETSLTYRERQSLVDQQHSLLAAAAKNLRLTDSDSDIGKGSELAEIVLYGVMRHHFKALPAVPKIFYKQNSQDNAKGADSVHIIVDKDDFTLWLGEAKFYKSIDDTRLPEIISSVSKSLQPEKLKKENAIITNLSEINHFVTDESLREEIRSFLSHKSSVDKLKAKLNVPILLLHKCEITSKHKEMSDAYRSEVIEHHRDRATAYFSKQIASIGNLHKYSEIKFHLILIPVPDKDQIVDSFVRNVAHYKEQ